MVSAHRASAWQPTCATRSAIAARGPLTLDLAAVIAQAWTRGSYADLADAAIDAVAEHIRKLGIAGVDPRLGEAIADAIRDSIDRDYAPTPAPADDDGRQLTLADAIGGAS